MDQNIISDLQDKNSQTELEALDILSKRGDVKFVLSPWHWVEAAGHPQEDEARKNAHFLDSLDAWWLHERTVIEERELRAYLDGRPGDITAINPIAHSKSEVADALHSRGVMNILSSSYEMVQALRKSPDAVAAMKEAWRNNEFGFKKKVELVKSRKLTEEQAWVSFLQGLAASCNLDPDKVSGAKSDDFRTITSEFKAGWLRWERGSEDPNMRLSPGRVKDSFHIVVALPYVDFFVCRDKKLINLFDAVRKQLLFPTAEAISSLTQMV